MKFPLNSAALGTDFGPDKSGAYTSTILTGAGTAIECKGRTPSEAKRLRDIVLGSISPASVAWGMVLPPSVIGAGVKGLFSPHPFGLALREKLRADHAANKKRQAELEARYSSSGLSAGINFETSRAAK